MTSQRAFLRHCLWYALSLACGLLLAASGPNAACAQIKPLRPFEFALLGDPQIGFGNGGEFTDGGRLERVVARVNATNVALSLVAGDLVQDRTIWQKWIFARAIGRMRSQAWLAPGNHDVVDKSSLATYRSRFGRDYYDVVVNECAFVILNSETARSPELSRLEFEKQWAFIEQTLANHQRAKRWHIVLVMHRPPFIEREDEAADDRNWPIATRQRLMSLVRARGVRWILAGHLHMRTESVTPDGVHVLVSAGSARNFDASPLGFDLFRIAHTGLSHQFVVVGTPPAVGFKVRGLGEWTPRLFAFSTRHWLFTLLYWVVGLIVFHRARGRSVVQSAEDMRGQAGFRGVALALFALGANMQLDLDELIRESGRLLARTVGLYDIRHYMTGTMAAAGVLITVAFLWRLYQRSAQPRALTIALAFLCVPLAWFGLSTISHHDLGMVISEDAWDAGIVGSLLAIAICARVSHKRSIDDPLPKS